MLQILGEKVQMQWVFTKDCVKDFGLLGCDNASLDKRILMFGRNQLFPSSWTLKT
jgi:hypothetical protein